MFLKAKIGPSDSQIELPKKFGSFGGVSKNKGGFSSKHGHLSKSVNFVKSPPSKLLINSKKLTAVMVRHKPVATKQYIKQNLRPYADLDKVQFTTSENSTTHSTVPDPLRYTAQTRFLQSSFILQPDPSYFTANQIPEKRKVRKVRHKRVKKESKETEVTDPVEEEQPDDFESLHAENTRLQAELGKMVKAFEQYM